MELEAVFCCFFHINLCESDHAQLLIFTMTLRCDFKILSVTLMTIHV